jgi:lysozyme family protein
MISSTNKLTFDDCFARLLGNEGGYSNDPTDPGGETNWGISKRSYPDVDIRNLTKAQAKEIYLRDFWNPVDAVNLPSSIVYQLFDFAVNSSPNTAIRHFQRALGVADDGHFGPISKKAVVDSSESDMIMNLIAERLDFMTRLNNWKDAGKGWVRRVVKQLRYGAVDTD